MINEKKPITRECIEEELDKINGKQIRRVNSLVKSLMDMMDSVVTENNALRNELKSSDARVMVKRKKK